MKITELRIANFRCFKEAKLRIAPVTLITGANSAGKSSLVAPLLAWAQTDGMPALLSPNGRYVEMGGFREMVHGGEDGEIGVGFDVEVGADADSSLVVDAAFTEGAASSGLRLRELTIVGSYYKMHMASTGDAYEMTYEVTPADSNRLATLTKFRESAKGSDEPDLSHASELMDLLEAITDTLLSSPREDRPNIPSFRITDSSVPLKGRIELAEPRKLITAVYATRDLVESFVSSGIVRLAKAISEYLSFVSSFRLAPQRTYYEVAKADLAVGCHGENYVEQIAQWESTKAPEIDNLRHDLTELGVLSSLEVGRLGAGRMELKGKPKPISPPTNLTDLGFGTSQLLPVLVAVNQLSPGSVFVVAQPETHLHPEAQARLASYFVRLAKERSITFIVETHSEYLINRLRRLVAAGEIAEEEVSVAHVANSGKEAKMHPVDLRADGQIVGAPKDFFETYMMDVMKLAMGS